MLRVNWPTLEMNKDFYSKRPNDITLELVAFILSSLHTERDPNTLQPFILGKIDIQWFVMEFMSNNVNSIQKNYVI